MGGARCSRPRRRQFRSLCSSLSLQTFPSHPPLRLFPVPAHPQMAPSIKLPTKEQLLKYAPLALLAFGALAWLVTLGGVSALQAECGVGGAAADCRPKTGLSWWSLWWQAFLLLAVAGTVAAGVRSARVPAAVLVGLNGLLSILLADRHLSDPVRSVTRYSIASGASTTTDGRYDACAAGFIMTAMVNLLLVSLLTLDFAEVKEAGKDLKLPEMPKMPQLPKKAASSPAKAGAAAAEV